MAEPATYGCECGATYPMGHETTVYLFTRQPWLNYLSTICPHCKNIWWVWKLIEPSIRYMEANNTVEGDEINWCVNEFASDDEVARFADHNQQPLLKYTIPSPRQEVRLKAEIAYLDWVLDHDWERQL